MSDLIQPTTLGWQSLKLQDVIPTEVITAIKNTNDTILKYVDAYKAALNVAKTLSTTLSSDFEIADQVLNTLITAVVNLVKSLLDSHLVHVLFVPIQTKDLNGKSYVPKNITEIVHSLGADYAKLANVLVLGNRDNYEELIKKSNKGNSGFLQTVANSFFDEEDPNRPQYIDSDSAVACAIVLTGSTGAFDILNVAIALNRIFKTNTDFTGRTLPIPSNVKATLVCVPGAPFASVRIDWDPAIPVIQPLLFKASRITTINYAVIRSTDIDAASAKDVLDLFETNDLSMGLVSGSKKSKVLIIGPSTNNSYVDNEKLDPNETYYYAVAWQVELTENGATKTFPWGPLSSVRRVSAKRVKNVPNATPPNWTAIKSLAEFSPVLGQQVNRLLAIIESTASKKVGTFNSAITTSVDNMISTVEELADRLANLSQKLTAFTSSTLQGLPGIYSNAFFGQGGIPFLLSELSKLLNDTTDPNAPQFNNNEYVIGAVFVSGGPRVADVRPVFDLFKLLFGGGNEANPLYTILDQMDAIITQKENRAFNIDMSVVLGADGRPDNNITATVNKNTNTAFAEDLSPVSPTDNANPLGGYTNNPSPDYIPC